MRKQAFSAEIDFVAPAGAPTAHQAVTVTVVYAMYDGLPLYEKHVVVWKSVCLARRFMLKESEYVPRQARDEHREHSKTTTVFLIGLQRIDQWCETRPFLVPFLA